jgi:LysM repeat protein
MSYTVTDFYSAIEDSKRQSELLYGVMKSLSEPLEEQFPILPGDDAPVAWEEELYNLQYLINRLSLLYVIHKFFKLDKETAEKMLVAYAGGDSSVKVIMSVIHKVASYETPESIASQYGLDWRDICDFNGITAFDISAGTELAIPFETNPQDALQAFADNYVFDIPQGVRVLGTDLPNELKANSSTGDLQVLTHVDAFEQGIKNIVHTEPGELPLYPNYGFDQTLNQDLPEDVRYELLKTNLTSALEQDGRILSVARENIEITRTGDSLSITLQVIPINNLSYVDVSEEL